LPVAARGGKEKTGNNASLEAVPFTTFKGQEVAPAFSPDGSQITFAWDGGTDKNFDLYVKVVGKPANNWGGLSLSPDGQWLAYSQVDDTPADIMLVENFN
jgi:Tol biopolymer transport system component